jgi:hypothetical protein
MISGRSFANVCKWVFDPRYPEMNHFHYANSLDGDWVFVNGDYLEGLVQTLTGTKKFTFIIHNSDRSFGEQQLSRLLPHANQIYAINTTIRHPNLTTIPIGFVDNQLPFLSQFQRPNVERDIEIYGNFDVNTNPAKRAVCKDIFKDDPRVTWRTKVSVPEYYADLCRSKYVLCPDGTGTDTHRVYESILCGATPVVLRNSLSHLYEKLPVCIVDSWTDPFYEVLSKTPHFEVYEYLEKVSIIIPTYNRFKNVLNTIESAKAQTYPNTEIIVVNDCSTQPEYYTHTWEGVRIIHLPTNTQSTFGFPCAGYVRNQGIQVSTGKYIAFCDDDDIWFPKKLELQIRKMKETACKMSSTDGLNGAGVYDSTKTYPVYNAESCYQYIRDVFRQRGSSLLENGYPDIWTLDFIRIHNCVICSSVVMEKELLTKIGNMKHVTNGLEDYDCWLRALEHTNSVYVRDVCFYYDSLHGRS